MRFAATYLTIYYIHINCLQAFSSTYFEAFLVGNFEVFKFEVMFLMDIFSHGTVSFTSITHPQQTQLRK